MTNTTMLKNENEWSNEIGTSGRQRTKRTNSHRLSDLPFSVVDVREPDCDLPGWKYFRSRCYKAFYKIQRWEIADVSKNEAHS